jgi:hypothetical protein
MVGITENGGKVLCMMNYLILILMVAFHTAANAAAVNDGPLNVYHSLSDNPTGETPTYSWQRTPTPMGNAASRGYAPIGGASTIGTVGAGSTRIIIPEPDVPVE